MIVFGCICAHADLFCSTLHICIYTYTAICVPNLHDHQNKFIITGPIIKYPNLSCNWPVLCHSCNGEGGWVFKFEQPNLWVLSLFCCFQHFEPGSKFISVMLNLFPTAILREGNLRNVFAKLPWIRQFYAILRRPCYILYQGHWGKQSCYSVQFSSEIWESRLVMKGMKVKCLSNPLFPF